MKCLKTSILFLFLLSNLAFAAGGGAAAEKAKEAILFEKEFCFEVNYLLAFEADNEEFKKERLVLDSLYEEMMIAFDDYKKMIIGCNERDLSKEDFLEALNNFQDSKTMFLEASIKRLERLKKLAEDGQIKLKFFSKERLGEGGLFEGDDFKVETTRREIFTGLVVLQIPSEEDSLKHLEYIETKLQKEGASDGLIALSLESKKRVDTLVQKFNEENSLLVKAVCGEAEVANDFSVLDLLLKINKTGLEIHPIGVSYLEKILEELGFQFIHSQCQEERANTNGISILDFRLSYYASSSSLETDGEIMEGFRGLDCQ